ncbi:DUF6882 domain-containing protein [Parerythrobacter aestuarii]|uniref:DUF6882 domain-containing protein n=1 Tax=Parerythrobacter aestuarii TaxID=3020909 RepID=UPI0024DE19CC|nr:DUF6882 domain-containing protein [Parerythrobacter aestuarii]
MILPAALFLSMVLTGTMPEDSSNSGNESAEASNDRMADAPDLAVARAMSGLQQKTQFHIGTWKLDESSWAVDLDRGVIEFTNKEGWLISAPVQVIGTHDTRDGTFMWGWDHPSVPAASAQAALLLKTYAEAHGLTEVSTQLGVLSDERAWELTALADYLAESNGAYRAPIGTTNVYMTFGQLNIAKE